MEISFFIKVAYVTYSHKYVFVSMYTERYSNKKFKKEKLYECFETNNN